MKDRLLLSLMQITSKTSESMRQNLSHTLSAPASQNGILSKLGLSVTTNGENIVIQSNLPDYAIYVEKGRGPGKMPPQGVLVPWLKLHGIDEAAEFPIRRKIAKQGTKPHPFLNPLTKLVSKIKRECLKITKENIQEVLSEDLQTIPTEVNGKM